MLKCDSLQAFTWKDTAIKKKYFSYTYNEEKALPTSDDVSRNGYRLEGWYKDWSYTDGPYSVVEAGTLEVSLFMQNGHWMLKMPFIRYRLMPMTAEK